MGSGLLLYHFHGEFTYFGANPFRLVEAVKIAAPPCQKQPGPLLSAQNSYHCKE